jgi:phosphomethylpyrimidine synthase
MCRRHFCSMKITGDGREHAAEKGAAESEAFGTGLKEKAKEFVANGAEVYSGA